MKGVILGVSIAVGGIGSAAAQSPDPSSFVGVWCSGTLHHLDSASIELTIASVNDGVAFGTYVMRGPGVIDVSITGTVAGESLKIAVDLNVSLELALRNSRLDGTFSNHRVGKRWGVTLTKKVVC
jgi:hypothetical protein